MKSFDEAINIRYANIDKTTGETISHSEKYTRAINLLGGLDAIIPLIPFTRGEIKRALETDEHLNNLDMKRWDRASGFICSGGTCMVVSGGIWDLYRKAGISSASNSQGVCLLKEAARQWAEREEE